jgi:1,4-dihydroxy-2-naphthoate octaprenyltransferase
MPYVLNNTADRQTIDYDFRNTYMYFKFIIEAASLNTLPLSLAGPILAGGFAVYQQNYHSHIMALNLLTALLLQLIFNLSKSYQHYATGENKGQTFHREIRSIMANILALLVIAVIFSGTTLIYLAFENNAHNIGLFIFLGIICLAAALSHILTSNLFKRAGFEQFTALIFNGFVGVLVSHYLYKNQLESLMLLPALSLGLLTVCVVNINQILTLANDLENRKSTLATVYGPRFCIYSQFILITLATVAAALFILLAGLPKETWMFVFALPALYGSAITIKHYPEDTDLVKFQLTKTAIASFAFTTLSAFGLGF